MDDNFVWHDKDYNYNDLLSSINSIYLCIQLTDEKEGNNSHSCLDVSVSIYHSGLPLPMLRKYFNVYTPPHFKLIFTY